LINCNAVDQCVTRSHN